MLREGGEVDVDMLGEKGKFRKSGVASAPV
jgi:hypothetical protein